MFRLTLEAQSIEELNEKIEQMYTHTAIDASNNCERCDAPDCTRNQKFHETMRELKDALAADTAEAALAEEKQEPTQAAAVPEGPTAEEVRAVLNDLRKAKGIAAVKKILAAHGAENFPGLDASHYADVLKEVRGDATE
jgi:uncharacterized membrane protein YgaE (UPF0421/DUF939 family)